MFEFVLVFSGCDLDLCIYCCLFDGGDVMSYFIESGGVFYGSVKMYMIGFILLVILMVILFWMVMIGVVFLVVILGFILVMVVV